MPNIVFPSSIRSSRSSLSLGVFFFFFTKAVCIFLSAMCKVPMISSKHKGYPTLRDQSLVTPLGVFLHGYVAHIWHSGLELGIV